MMSLEQLNEKIENFRWKLSADGEIQIGKHYLDGYDMENRVIYQFNGCFFIMAVCNVILLMIMF